MSNKPKDKDYRNHKVKSKRISGYRYDPKNSKVVIRYPEPTIKLTKRNYDQFIEDNDE